MVFVSLAESVPMNAEQVAEKLKDYGVLVGAVSERGFRMVLHLGIEDRDIDDAIAAFAEVLH
jgi:threonine aldolase